MCGWFAGRGGDHVTGVDNRSVCSQHPLSVTKSRKHGAVFNVRVVVRTTGRTVTANRMIVVLDRDGGMNTGVEMSLQ